MFLKEKLAQKITAKDVYEAEALVTAHMPGVPFNRAAWDTGGERARRRAAARGDGAA